MIAALARAARALADAVQFWTIYLLFLVACAFERDEDEGFDLEDHA